MFYFLIVNKACPVTISNCPSKFAPPQRNIIHPLQAVHGVSCNFSDKIITSSLLQENRCDTILIASSSEMIHLTHFLMTHLSLSWVLVKKYGNSCFYYLLQKNKFTVKEFFFCTYSSTTMNHSWWQLLVAVSNARYFPFLPHIIYYQNKIND